MSQNKVLYSVEENPPFLITISQAFQHVLSSFSALIVLPSILASTITLPEGQLEHVIFTGILLTAITTAIQALRVGKIGAGYILLTGSASSFLSCSISAAQIGGIPLLATLSLLSAPLEFLLAYFLGHLRKILTPLVGGVIIMIVAITLIPVALTFWVGPSTQAPLLARQNLFLGLVSFLIILGFTAFGNKKWRIWGPFAGILGGYLLALAIGRVDATLLQGLPLLGVPPLSFPGFAFSFQPDYIAVFITFLVVTMASTIETVGDCMAIQRISHKNPQKIDYHRVQGALYSDALGNMMAGLLGTLPNSTFSGNIGIVEVTGVASKKVGVLTAILLGLCAFIPPLRALILSVPQPVLGATLFVFFSLLFMTGMKLVMKEGLDGKKSLLVGVSFWAGFASHNGLLFPSLISPQTAPFFQNGIAVGGTVAVFLSLLFSLFPGKRSGITLKREKQELLLLQDFLKTQAHAFGISEKNLWELELLCEEVFLYLIREAKSTSKISFTLTKDEEGLLMEVQDRSETEDLEEQELPTDIAHATENQLENLGLVFLTKMASQVVHTKISGVNYISFRLEEHGEAKSVETGA